MESSILESIGVEIIGVMSPVSICMFLVVLLVYSLSTSSSSVDATIRTAANLVYAENPSDTAAEKLEGALLNALVFVILIALVTFLLVLLYYYNCTAFLRHYMRFSAFFVLASMGGSIFLSLIQRFSIPLDSITCFLLLFNFTVVGVLSVFAGGIPILLRQGYMVCLGIIVAAWFTKLPEWTTWVLLVALAVYDLVAVLAPGGPLKLLVDLASTRNEELPALVYEARPTVALTGRRGGGASTLGLLVTGVSESEPRPESSSIELQTVSRDNVDRNEIENENEGHFHGNSVVSQSSRNDEEEISPLVGNRSSSTQFGRREVEIVDEEMSPLVEMIGMGNEGQMMMGRDGVEIASRGIKLGLGDFVFYSVLVGRAAMYDLMTVYACYLAIISGLGCTLILLSVCRQALPALPVSITLGVLFYFLTRLLMEPFIVGTATNLMMF
ncbi:presenilin-like protein At1g08700 [Gastrolobium bilobum]|uniref:presenilin-like protein At1g08700 n=1 Tax=Gastrolobium bilobum TaxID=150636 RepID=UPI002AAF4C76|nr:presenilin-like protein At1g08700 [Gastrolobium bilobum]